MLPNAAAPTTGADSTRPAAKRWQIYMIREGLWVPVGACATRSLAEIHIASLRKMMRLNRFQLVWEGDGDAPA